jgi:hypothetical protein
MRRSTAAIRRAIQFEKREAERIRANDLESPNSRAFHVRMIVADALRWAAGDAGTEYERIMRGRLKESLGRMPGKGKS